MKEYLQQKINNEQRIIDRLKVEVTRDPDLCEAEIRMQAFSEVLKHLNREAEK